MVNATNQEEEVKLLTKKVLLTVHHNLGNNRDLASENKETLSRFPPLNDLHVLDTYFWDSVDKRIAEIDIEYHIIEDLLLLKKCAEDCNKSVEALNKAVILYKKANDRIRKIKDTETIWTQERRRAEATNHYDKLVAKNSEFINLAQSALKNVDDKIRE